MIDVFLQIDSLTQETLGPGSMDHIRPMRSLRPSLWRQPEWTATGRRRHVIQHGLFFPMVSRENDGEHIRKSMGNIGKFRETISTST